MYVCICNNLNEEQIKEAVDQGADTPQKIIAFYKSYFCCRACVSDIEKICKDMVTVA